MSTNRLYRAVNLEQYLKPTFRYIKSFYDPSYIIEGE